MKTLVLCIDALFSRDLKTLKSDPNFAPLFHRAVAVENIEAVYPTLTYPTHVSIVSGVTPKNHGVIANQPLDPATENYDWFWYYDQIHAKTVFDALHEANLTTSAIFWPVTAGGPIDYLVPEIWGREADALPIVRAYSSHNIDDILEAHRAHLTFEDKLEQDTYGCLCAEDIIHRHNPDVMFVHFCLIDKTRHVYGIDHPYIQRDLKVMGKLFARIMDAVHDVQQEEPTVVILGDHGHIDYTHNLLPNTEFEKLGWVDRIHPENYQVYCHGCGISAQIYLRSRQYAPEVETLFDNWKRQGYLYDYYTREEVSEMGLDGGFAYVLEAADGFSIISSFGSSFVDALQLPEGSAGCGNHGHLPGRGNKPPFMVSSPSIQGFTRVENGSMLDLAATLCGIHGIEPWQMQGNEIKEIVQSFRINDR